ncbi:hypothetical protein K440DRAFT_644667 [Wilcoxina mikolae CBS 423.85]|nr:hypothetical protein K440DRAFT_644667 [Wilcoxina mikolae CBS 423.85]
MSAYNTLPNPSINSTPSNFSNLTPPTTSTSSTPLTSIPSVTAAYHHHDVLNESSTSRTAPNTSATPVFTPTYHHPDKDLKELSTSRSSSATSSSSDIVEQHPSGLSSPSRITSFSIDSATVARELEMPASTSFEMDKEKEEDDSWDFKCIGLDRDPACSEEGTGGI